MSQHGDIPSPISINPGFTGEITPETAALIKKEAGARSFVLICFDDTMPCAEERAGRDCTFGHKYHTTYDGVEHFNYHEALIQILRQCEGHKHLLTPRSGHEE